MYRCFIAGENKVRIYLPHFIFNYNFFFFVMDTDTVLFIGHEGESLDLIGPTWRSGYFVIGQILVPVLILISDWSGVGGTHMRGAAHPTVPAHPACLRRPHLVPR